MAPMTGCFPMHWRRRGPSISWTTPSRTRARASIGFQSGCLRQKKSQGFAAEQGEGLNPEKIAEIKEKLRV
eukprot:12924604-Prorocentrum_lima.AAC.1